MSQFHGSSYGKIISNYNESVFFDVNTIDSLKSHLDHIWNLTVPKYTGWSGIGAVQCPSNKEEIQYQFTQDDLNLILK